ncbi:MAG: hypothetical protein ABT20_11570 [Rubrivivax sp. SCN 70-15]|nr:MAG: hypothetical protein ABT20_11570 [Rubrivivax sp. SCN 70-15]
MAARGERADEDAVVRLVRGHADAVAEHRAAADRAGRVDRDHADAPAARAQLADQCGHQRRLAAARRPGDADHVGPADMRRKVGAQGGSTGAVVLEFGDGAGEAQPVAGQQALDRARRCVHARSHLTRRRAGGRS